MRGITSADDSGMHSGVGECPGDGEPADGHPEVFAGDTCQLFFSAGQCADAKLGSFEGEAAVFQVVRWPAGEFEIDFNSAPERTTISRTTTGLLMEALRLMDEGQRDGDTENVEATEG